LQLAVHVHQAAVAEQLGHPGALFGQEAAVFLVAAPVLQVGLLVGNVDVAAQDELALAFERHQVRVHEGEKAVFGFLALGARRATGKVSTDQRELSRGRVNTQFHITAFGVKFATVKTHHHVARFVAGVHAHAGIPFFLGAVKVAIQARQRFKTAAQVRGLRLDFLYTNTIGLVPGEPRLQSFGAGRADAVEVEAGQFEQGIPHGVGCGHGGCRC
jgi:hypothetical protein